MKNQLIIPIIAMSLFALAGCLGNSSQSLTTPGSGSESNVEVATQAEPIVATSPDPTQALKASGSPFEPIAGAPPMDGCTVATLLPGADPAVTSAFPEVGEEDWIRGPSDAAVTLVQYADFQSVQNAQFAPVLILLQQEFPEDLRMVFRHFPQLNTNDKSGLALQASEAAGLQDKFWEMHDLLFLRQQEWATLPESDFRTWISDRTTEIGINANQFEAAMALQNIVDMPRLAFDEAFQIGIPGVPFC
ncbi:MAG: thioredoxin domain-containing protein [Anaerolineae bacterium]|nr:thioredoxin domain-containing protein [Anaerolineae bacterium]